MKATRPRHRRDLFAPEVVQTSAMDCGPAALTSLLQGHGLSVSYGRLREACQTDVDGTSIDMLESIAVQCGLNAEQIMVPVDHLLLPETGAFPAIVVVRQPSGTTHFVVAWRRHGRLVQVMDPGTGRRWPTCRRFLDDLHVHRQAVPAADWRAWAETDEFLGGLRRRWAALALRGTEVEALLTQVLADPEWLPLATLDATTRMLTALVHGGGLRRGQQATGVFVSLFARACQEDPARPSTVPEAYWMVRPAPQSPDGTPALLVRGAVLVRINGWQASAPAPDVAATVAPPAVPTPRSADLVAALEAPPSRPGRQLLRLLRADGLLTPAALGLGVSLAAASVMVEALLWRGIVDINRQLNLVEQGLGALGALLVFISALLLLDLVNAMGLWRLGRRLEVRLRIAFLTKLPRLGDRYFQSRPASDMAERSHSVHRLRVLPHLGGQLIHVATELVATTAGLVWLDPAHALLTVGAAISTQVLPLAMNRLLTERDLRVRTHAGALGRFSLEALLGLTAIRTHGAEQAMRREHESLLVEWLRAGLRLQRTLVGMEGVQGVLGCTLTVGLLAAYLARGGEASGALLLVYWALRLPALGQEMLALARQYPAQRNTTLRLLEPLGAREERDADAAARPAEHTSPALRVAAQGVAIALEGVSVRAAGHTILTDVNLTLAPGSHVAIVGTSGAGKSSLVGLLLGWHRPATGRVLVEGRPLDDEHLSWVRQITAWVDPATQIWNRSLLDNLCYGAAEAPAALLTQALAQAELRSVLDRLPDGLQTPLGEGGRLLSGGEGQRVRFGRALARRGVRLAILDEPFRGLDRQQRHTLLQRARQAWSTATVLCITHDVGATQAFDRVLVVEAGRIIEDGAPAALASSPESRYRALLDAEAGLQAGLWSNGLWRRLQLVEGRLCEDDRRPSTSAFSRHQSGGE